MASYPTNVGPGLFLQTTDIFDIRLIPADNPLLRNLFVRINQAFGDANRAINIKDTGIYDQSEFVNGQTYFPNPSLSSTTTQRPTQRQVFRKVFLVGALANAGTTTIAHGITVDGNTTFTRIYGTANAVGVAKSYIPLPFVSVSGSVAAGNIELRADDTNIYITTTGNGTNFTVNYVVLEYLKN